MDFSTNTFSSLSFKIKHAVTCWLSGADTFMLVDTLPLTLSWFNTGLNHTSSRWTSGNAFNVTFLKIPKNLKKSWSSKNAAVLILCTCTASTFPFSLIYGVRSNSEGVKLSSAYPINWPFSHRYIASSTPSKQIWILFPHILLSKSKYLI